MERQPVKRKPEGERFTITTTRSLLAPREERRPGTKSLRHVVALRSLPRPTERFTARFHGDDGHLHELQRRLVVLHRLRQVQNLHSTTTGKQVKYFHS